MRAQAARPYGASKDSSPWDEGTRLTVVSRACCGARPRRHGGTVRCLRALLRAKLVHHDASGVEGYRLTPLGYDFLALRALLARGAVTAVGRQIGVGKESDVFEVRGPPTRCWLQVAAACPPRTAALVGGISSCRSWPLVLHAHMHSCSAAAPCSHWQRG